jgi:2-polyprenyl-3-methyl-5-hydroxy-6-metoxy-1,4-benzoquinol methylase
MHNYDEHYVEALQFAMRRYETRSYILPRIDDSLRQLKVNPKCVNNIISLLACLIEKKITGTILAEQVSRFQKDWRPHLDRVYLHDYEETRWAYMSEFVFSKIEGGNILGRCLDVGCGRGCVTANMVKNDMVSAIVGIDAEDFRREWRERESLVRKHMKFESVQVSRIEDWLRSAGQFDTILLFYVLHHSEEYWCARTLRALRRSLMPGGRLIVLEDSLASDGIPLNDGRNLTSIWRGWAAKANVYSFTAAFDAQVILDFVAVQLLAGFWDVRMSCNYKINKDWEKLFQEIGYRVMQTTFIGFPLNRDIDVPQTMFVLAPDDAV